ncbi:MAG TPA: hypothetical protein QGI07_04815 [Dehalococcoidia bacterium]|jgi:hypothetical protein|nr:hypothetical protein [Chloroflexota bacterium]MDP5876239.1 hypothetical protein [Dehalococcoidia bacterium]MDP6272636.1 hypothetical protein [Dehalococcoidia bacterium]MDP7161412.1 hypothetical protein [Dehalococcoidia bacterium]MDP7212661.1 hypothetical protein [Dehalococcoidia bacterium]|tara:strand:+ start:1019 stop:1270 length:252 start_codon:yes stop_codon:yes gene_type:complete
MACRSILALPAAGVGLFFSAFILKIGLGSVSGDLGINDFGYLTSMYITLVLWVVIAPAVSVMVRVQLRPLTFSARRGRIIDID